MDLDMDLDMEKEDLIRYGGLISGISLILLAFFFYITGLQSVGIILFVIGFIAAITPYSFQSYLEHRRLKTMESHFPNLLKDIAESKKSGLSLVKAFQRASKSDYGELNSEIQKVSDQLSWGISFPEVMQRFMDRVEDSGLMSRSLAIILQSFKSGGDISVTMDAIAKDASTIKETEEERKSMMFQQVIIIYAIFFLFVVIVIAMYKILVPLLETTSSIQADTGPFAGGSANYCNVPFVSPMCQICPALGFGEVNKYCYYKALFMFMILIQGLFNGLVASVTGEGDLKASFKHILFMAPPGFFIYLFFVL